MSKRFRNNNINTRPRANVANNNNSNRPDDFVDNNSTHISAITYLYVAHPEFATCEDNVRDDEF